MSILKITKHGNHFGELKLEQGNSYVLGRGGDCNFILESSKSISRQHLRIEFENGRWMAHLVSKVGQMLKNDEPVLIAELSNSVGLYIDPYEIHLEESNAEVNLRAHSSKAIEPNDLKNSNDQFDFNEATAVVSSQLTAHVSIELPTGQTQSVELTLPITQFGRDESNTVQIDDGKVSRNHFEIRHVAGSTYQITDLGSANGTSINGLPLEAHQAHQLNSRDVITISKTTIIFELRDPKFENLMHHLAPVTSHQPETAPSGYGMIPYDYSAYSQAQGPSVVKVNGSGNLKEKFIALPKKTKMRIGLGAALAIIVSFLLFDSGKGPKTESTQSSVQGESQISTEQQAVIKDTFYLARNHFMQGKYELCSAEITKLHDLVPFFENSKELEVLCSQARELQDHARETERLAKQKEAIEKQVEEVVAECRIKLPTFRTEEEINACLGQAIELDPQNASIEEMRNYLKIKGEEKQAQVEQEDAYRRRIAAGESKLGVARNLKSKSLLKKAIGAYEDYIGSSYPDPKNLKTVARRELAAVKSDLNQKISSRLSKCRSLLQQNQNRNAVIACDEVLKEDPSHEEAQETKRLATANLRKDMRGIYEDAILEESLGNIDAAKDKWKKIVAEDLRDGEHATKAKIKLRKYGVEL